MHTERTACDELAADNARKLSARFFLRVGQAGRAAPKRDEYTAPLFPLALILEAEGLLARDLAYLQKCEALIKQVAREMLG
ncbi:MAG: hypothetical protein U1A72_16230 [Sulfuritalea sp.]|nr:hypothetical protein [Sulfuritalea sp.]